MDALSSCTRASGREFFPLGDDLPEVETIRQRTLHVGARFEREALSPAKDPAPATPAEAMTVSTMAAMSDRHTAIKVARSRSLSLTLAMTMVSRSCSQRARRGGQATPAIKRCAAKSRDNATDASDGPERRCRGTTRARVGAARGKGWMRGAGGASPAALPSESYNRVPSELAPTAKASFVSLRCS